MKLFSDLSREERIQKIMEMRRQDLCLVLENLAEDLNISAILRTAEAFGIGQVCIVYPEGQKKPKLSIQTSVGAQKWLNIQFFTDITECLTRLKSQGFKIFGTIVDPQAKLLWQEDFSGKVVIMMGNEAAGLSETAQKLTDQNLYIPMFGLTESLNVGVAAAICLYEVVRQKEKAVRI